MKQIYCILLGLCSFGCNILYAAAPYPAITPPTAVSLSDKIEYAANWLNANTHDAQISPGLYALMPKSYQDSWQNYWQYLKDNNSTYRDYLANNDTGTCTVSANNQATIERAVMHNGVDVYDGAVWMMALANAYDNSNISKTNKDYYLTSIEKYKNLLMASRSEGFNSYRAYQGGADGKTPYLYGPRQQKEMSNANQAYLLKFITPSWAKNLDPVNNCDMQWPIYDAVTGEQAWAALIGPVQTAYLINDGAKNSAWANSEWINFAMDSLPALAAMQDPNTGGVYRNVLLPDATPATQHDAYQISLENDFSLYAGLDLLELAIKTRIANTSGTGQQSSRLDDALNLISHIKAGLVKFFSSDMVYNQEKGYFVSQIEKQADGSYQSDNVFALDVQTWGISVILSDPKLMQAVIAAHGQDALYRMWDAAIKYSGYYNEQGQLLGVGYTEQTKADPFYEMSGEWTLGAINAAIDLASVTTPGTGEYIKLVHDAKAMQAGINSHIATMITGKHNQELGYLYANKRALIPFGWYSNVMPATASTAWGLMVNNCYNPFALGGGKTQARLNVCAEVL